MELTTLSPGALRAKLDEIEKQAYEMPVTIGFAHTESLCALARKLLAERDAAVADRDRLLRIKQRIQALQPAKAGLYSKTADPHAEGFLDALYAVEDMFDEALDGKAVDP